MAKEIEVGEGRFAAGDQVITRVNDRAQEIYNRERWRVAAVDAEQRTVILEGIDQARRIQVGADYLARTNPHNDAPALQHAYAITTYSAQGTTVDRAYVAADPSMDKQELYVAASRSREETYLYATPEIQIEREEYAPRSPYLREGIPADRRSRRARPRSDRRPRHRASLRAVAACRPRSSSVAAQRSVRRQDGRRWSRDSTENCRRRSTSRSVAWITSIIHREAVG